MWVLFFSSSLTLRRDLLHKNTFDRNIDRKTLILRQRLNVIRIIKSHGKEKSGKSFPPLFDHYRIQCYVCHMSDISLSFCPSWWSSQVYYEEVSLLWNLLKWREAINFRFIIRAGSLLISSFVILLLFSSCPFPPHKFLSPSAVTLITACDLYLFPPVTFSVSSLSIFWSFILRQTVDEYIPGQVISVTVSLCLLSFPPSPIKFFSFSLRRAIWAFPVLSSSPRHLLLLLYTNATSSAPAATTISFCCKGLFSGPKHDLKNYSFFGSPSFSLSLSLPFLSYFLMSCTFRIIKFAASNFSNSSWRSFFSGLNDNNQVNSWSSSLRHSHVTTMKWNKRMKRSEGKPKSGLDLRLRPGKRRRVSWLPREKRDSG